MIEMQLGFIGNDIVAICADAEADYAFYAKQLKSGKYEAKMSSTHGVISSGVFSVGVGARQMVYYSMAKHLEVVDEAAEERLKVEKEPIEKSTALH